MNNKLIKYTTALSVLLMIITLTQVFCVTKDNQTVYSIVTVGGTLLLSAFYTISILKKDIKTNKLYGTLLAVCYFLTFHNLYTTYVMDNYQIIFLWVKELIIIFVLFATYFLFLVIGKNKEGFKLYKITRITIYVLAVFVIFLVFADRIIRIKPGICLYLASFIPIIINACIIKEEDKIKEPTELMITEPIDIEDSYVFANYVEGLQDDYDIKHNLSALMNKEEAREIVVGIFGREPIRIEYIKVKKITLQYETLKLEEKKKKKDREVDRLYVLGQLLKYLSAEAASVELRAKLDYYDNLKTNKVYHLIITYEHKKEEKYIHLYTKTEPSIFVETLEKTVPFPIERVE